MISRSDDEASWAGLADLVTTLAREIQNHGYEDVADLVASEQHVIRFIDHNPGSSPSVVAEGTGLQRSNLSAALRSLEAKGFVERRPDPNDARGVQLWHTEKADANLARLRAAWSELLGEAAGRSGADAASLQPAVALLRSLESGLVAGRRRNEGKSVGMPPRSR